MSFEQHPMIDVDGAQKHRHNSDGEPIHHTDEGIRNFHRWFGDSKVVDHHGRPLVVYHGTSHDVDEFDGSKPGHYFTPDISYGHIQNAHKLPQFHGNPNGAGNVIPSYIKIHNPLYSTTPSEIEGVGYNHEWSNELKSKGYDGIIHAKKHDIYKGPSGWGDDRVQMFITHPNQVKSAIGNKGSFSLKSNKLVESIQLLSFKEFLGK